MSPFGGRGGRRELEMGPLSCPVVTSYSNHRLISHRFRSAPTCHGQTDGRNLSSKNSLRTLVFWQPVHFSSLASACSDTFLPKKASEKCQRTESEMHRPPKIKRSNE